MNLVDCYVTSLLGKPKLVYGKWWRPVEFNSYGRVGSTSIPFDTLEECLKVKIGYHFLN